MFPLWDAAAQHFSKVKRLLVAGYYSVFPSKNRQILRRIARISGCYTASTPKPESSRGL